MVAAAILGYFLWQDYRQNSRTAEEDRMALMTARVWVKTARYAGQTDRFVAWRDSTLAAEGMSKDEVAVFLDRWTNHQEEYLSFTQKVQKLVDSLARIEDSLITAEERAVSDTVK